MKKFFTCVLTLGAIAFLSSCVSVDRENDDRTTTTTTEETTLSRPGSSTVETQTIRSY